MAYDNMISRTDTEALMPDEVSREMLNSIGRRSFVLSTARQLPDMPRGVRKLPIIKTLPTAAFVSGDTGLAETADMAWTTKELVAEDLETVIAIPNTVLDDTDYDIWTAIRPDIESAFSEAIDRMVLYGGMSGVPKPSSDWPDGLVRAATAASMTVSLVTMTDIYDATLGEDGTFNKVEANGYMVTGNVAALTMKARLRGARDADGNRIFEKRADEVYDLDGTPLVFPDNGSVDPTRGLLVSGDFRQLVWAVRQDITYTITTSGVISNAAGQIVYNLFQQNMTGMRVVMRLAWQVLNPPNRIKPTYDDVTRYPFAVLTS